MTKATAFTPDWVSPPGNTIADILDEKNITALDFARKMGLSEKQVHNLLSGRKRITPKIAYQLQETVGSSSDFWMKRELLFRERLKKQQIDNSNSSAEWLSTLPLNDLIQFGWVKEKYTAKQQIDACLNFFGVLNVEEWYDKYDAVLSEAAFRTSPTFTSHASAVAAWLRKGEIEGRKAECNRWSATKFHNTLLKIRRLTRQRNPDFFIPEIKKYCAICGVAVTIIPTPKGCRASGASLFLSPCRALINLSFRYLSDDHFWFTFFHEAAHLILHGKKDLFLDGEDIESTKEEEEANEFAAAILIPPEFQEEFFKLSTSRRSVIRFARRAGVSPGIVVGQLQHFGIVKRNQLNYLKRRYMWETA